MTWFNEPKDWKKQGEKGVTATAEKGTDFWRKTHYGFIRHSGHFYRRKVSGDFTAQVKVSGKHRNLYDQAGLMVRLNERMWIKTGIEYVEGEKYFSAVVTKETSDWSTALAGNPEAVWLKLTRQKDCIIISYSLDGKDFNQLPWQA